MPLRLNEREARTWAPKVWYYVLTLGINDKLCHTITYCSKDTKKPCTVQ